MSDVQNTTPEAAVASDVNNTKAPGRFSRAMSATGRGLRRGTTDVTVWTTATVLTIAEPIVELGKVVVHTADSKEDQVRSFGRNFIENRHARLVKSSETQVETLKRQLEEARALVLAADQQVRDNPAPTGPQHISLRPTPAS